MSLAWLVWKGLSQVTFKLRLKPAMRRSRPFMS